jgi:aminoglycoside phosphotransferase (APT) family kinase protein
MITDALAPETWAILQETVAQHVSRAARTVQVGALPIEGGYSGAEVRRFDLTLAEEGTDPATVRLVTKRAKLLERRALHYLNAQGQAQVPYSYTPDLATDAPALLCLQDLGSTERPTSLEPVTETVVRHEAAGLAAIHAANWGRADLDWLPRADRAYYAQMIEQIAWRPAWEQAVADPGFHALFGPELPRIEAAAATIVDEMAALTAEADTLTLVHSDINPGNVLLRDEVPYFIDWEAVHYGPCYLDVPHHFFTPELAEYYRAALAAQGLVLPAAHFAERWRIAARYTALRYMWWTFDAWREDPAEEVWVRHYFAMI